MSKGKNAEKASGESVTTLSDASAADIAAEIPQFQAPEGYVEQTSDVVGFWDGDKGLPLHFTPEEATLHDSDLDSTKVSILIRGRLVEPATLYLGEEVVEGDAGERVGVWAKPGMKSIRDLGGEDVWIRQTGEKDVGKKSPMKTFGVFSKRKGFTIPVVGDYRKDSKAVRHMLEGAPLSHSNPPRSRTNHASDDAGF